MKLIGLSIFAAFAFCFSGCASHPARFSTNTSRAEEPPVRRVLYDRTPDMKQLANRARQVGNSLYPKVLALLADDPSDLPRQFDIVFKDRLMDDDRGLTVGATVYLNAHWLRNNPDNLEVILVHEMAHVAEDYKWYRWFKTPRYWAEGIADYVRYKLGYTNGWSCPQCSVEFPHYTFGFWCAGAFLLFVESTCGPEAVRHINGELHRGRYSDRTFVEATGKSLDQLWVEFQATAAFTQVAAAVDQLYRALGYKNGKPPRGVKPRFEAYLKQQGETKDFRSVLGYFSGKPKKDLLSLYAFCKYLHEPGGAVEGVVFLKYLRSKGQLPGFAQGETGDLHFSLPDECHSDGYPVSRSFEITKHGDPTNYHYLLSAESKQSGWILQRAWHTSPDGRLIEEYSTR